MLISEIEPINESGRVLSDQENPEQIIDEIIELPLRKACKLFLSKGVQTVMSSANRNNILKPDEKPTEKEKLNALEYFDPSPTFEDAGRGYAWIMINFDTLSNENKDMLFDYEEKSKLGEELIWFVHPFSIGNLDYKIATGQLSIEFVQSIITESDVTIGSLENIKYDARLATFEKKHVVLAYNGRYPVNTVFLRMPINEATTVEDVEIFFTKFVELFRNQNQQDILNEQINDELSL